MARLAGLREKLERQNVAVVLVHLGSEAEGADFIRRFEGAAGFHTLADPATKAYAAFGLGAAGWGEILNPRVVARGLAALFRGHAPGRPTSDPRQMGGAFLVRDGRIAAAFRARDIADNPDYPAMLGELRVSGA